MKDFQQSDKGRMVKSHLTLLYKYIYILNMKCFEKVKFKYRVGSVNNFSKMKSQFVNSTFSAMDPNFKI